VNGHEEPGSPVMSRIPRCKESQRFNGKGPVLRNSERELHYVMYSESTVGV